MSIKDITNGPWVLCVSSNDDDDICTGIKDKGNGNRLAANDVDEDYTYLIAAAPEMYEMLEDYVSFAERGDAEGFNQMLYVVKELLSKARGEQQ